jgi:hypothetical protein
MPPECPPSSRPRAGPPVDPRPRGRPPSCTAQRQAATPARSSPQNLQTPAPLSFAARAHPLDHPTPPAATPQAGAARARGPAVRRRGARQRANRPLPGRRATRGGDRMPGRGRERGQGGAAAPYWRVGLRALSRAGPPKTRAAAIHAGARCARARSDRAADPSGHGRGGGTCPPGWRRAGGSAIARRPANLPAPRGAWGAPRPPAAI